MIKIDWRRAIQDYNFFGFFYYSQVHYYEEGATTQHISWSLDCLLKRGHFKDTIILYRL